MESLTTSHPVRILHVTTEKNWRGGENQIQRLILHSNNSGFEHYVAAQPTSAAESRFRDFCPILSVRMRNDFDVIAVLKILRFVRKNKISILHAHTARAHTLCLMVKKFTERLHKKTLKLIVHRRVQHLKKNAAPERLKYLDTDIDAYICVSKSIASDLINFGVPQQKVFTVYSSTNPELGSNRDHLRIKFRKQQNVPEDQVVISFVGSMEEKKGVFQLLEAAKNLLLKHQNIIFLFVGNGPLLDVLQDKARTAPLDHQIKFLGFQKDVETILCGSDILVLPSFFEGLGSILLDGIMCGCAVIGSPIGGIQEIVSHEKTGLLADPHHQHDLTVALESLVLNSALRKRLNEQGQAHVRSHFSLEAMIANTFAIYRSVLTT